MVDPCSSDHQIMVIGWVWKWLLGMQREPCSCPKSLSVTPQNKRHLKIRPKFLWIPAGRVRTRKYMLELDLLQLGVGQPKACTTPWCGYLFNFGRAPAKRQPAKKKMRNRRKPIEKAVCSGALSVDVLLFPVNCPTQIHIFDFAAAYAWKLENPPSLCPAASLAAHQGACLMNTGAIPSQALAKFWTWLLCSWSVWLSDGVCASAWHPILLPVELPNVELIAGCHVHPVCCARPWIPKLTSNGSINAKVTSYNLRHRCHKPCRVKQVHLSQGTECDLRFLLEKLGPWTLTILWLCSINLGLNLVWPTVAWPWPTHTSLHWAGWAGANLWPWRSAELQPILASSEGLHEGVHLRAAECKGHLNQPTDANKWSKKIKGVRQRNVHIVAYSRCRSVLSPEQVEAGGTCTFLSSCLKCLKRYDIPTVFYTSFAPKSWVINPVTPLEISRIPLKALFGRRPSGAFGRWSWATPGAEGQAHLASS